jgi:hypothetical protein
MLNVDIRLAIVCKWEILRFFGQIIRRNESSLKKLMIEEKIEGNMSYGRIPMCWIDQVNIITGYTLEGAIRSAENRDC